MKMTTMKKNTTAGLVICAALLLPAAAQAGPLFVTNEKCIACHNGLVTPTGQDVSIGFDWRPSMMANSARDPYWQAAVRRETLDHPEHSAAIQNECSACHMPMDRYQAKVAGTKGQVFAHLTAAARGTPAAALATDGVSCSICHQITPQKLGTRASFTAGFVVDTTRPLGQREVYGPFDVERGLAQVMLSASELQPKKSEHVRQSELCATCHTLFTHALGAGGAHGGALPEQVPYLEWKHSAYREERSCQSCHMPAAGEPVPIASVLGKPRDGSSRHVFRGGNFFMPRMLGLHRAELGVQALPQELDAVARRAAEHLQTKAATVAIQNLRAEGGTLEAEVAVTNLAGHKLPTAYPSRRVWLHVTVRDAGGKVLLESGALADRGRIRGNDNDDDPRRYEPHHAVITRPDEVQIYEAIMVDHRGDVTTGLLRGVRFVKDNRIPPRGFDKASAGPDIAVRGAAAKDPDFAAAGDRVRYRVPLAGARTPLRIEAELVYQPIGHRWAVNLGAYRAPEPARFVSYYNGMAAAAHIVLTRAALDWTPPPPPPPEPQPEPPADTE